MLQMSQVFAAMPKTTECRMDIYVRRMAKCRMDIHVRRMANNSDMNVQATGIATAHFTRNFSTVVLSAFRFRR